MLLEGNIRFQQKIMEGLEAVNIESKIPKYPLLILTCMDPRIDVHRIFQLEPGDAFVLRNAGNVYSKDVLRSIFIAIAKYEIKYIIILGHLGCGMTRVSTNQLKTKLSPNILMYLEKINVNLNNSLTQFFKLFADEFKNIEDQVKFLKAFPDFPLEVEITGMVYDVNTGWVFDYETIIRYKFLENFNSAYKELLAQKRTELITFLERNQKVGKQSPEILEIRERKQEIITAMNKSQYERTKFAAESRNLVMTEEISAMKKSKIEPKFVIPKIYFPKISISVPSIYNKKIFRKEKKME